MNGTLNRITRLAFSLLGGLCFTVASFSTLAAGPSQISVTVNPTTGYFESTARTIVPPTNATISPVKDVSATVVSRLPNGSLAQPISNGIEITAIKQQQLVKSNVVAKPSALRRAGASCFKSRKCNVAFFVGALGLEHLFDGLDWIMGEGGEVKKITQGSYPEASCSGLTSDICTTSRHSQGGCADPMCWNISGVGESGYILLTTPYRVDSCNNPSGCGATISTRPIFTSGREYTFQGVYGNGWNALGVYNSSLPAAPPSTTEEAVSDADIDAAFSTYNPDPTDWRFLVPGISLADPDVDIEITDAPRLATPPVTTTHYDAAGNPVTVSETNTWYDFAPKNNPSKQPELEAQKTETKNEYDAGGNPKGGTATTVVIPPASSPQAPESPESPIDCDLMPTLCEWMLWTKEPPPEGDEPDFDDIRQVIDLRDYQQSVDIGPATLACPEPYQIEIGFIGRSVGVSFQPFCDLADYVRPLLLMFAYFFGAYLTIRSI